MKYTVSNRTLNHIVSIAENDDDNPFGLTSFGITQDLIDRMDAALCGVDAETAARLQVSLEAAYENEGRGRETMHGDLDGLMVELLRSLGLDPLVVAWMARTGEGATLLTPEDPEWGLEIDPWTAPEDPSCDTEISLGPYAMWKGAHGVSVWAIPETVQAALVGRPLRDFFSHPVLDRHEITVTATRTDDDVTHIDVDYIMEMLKASDLFERRLVPA